jgi:polysaccharide deacetylase 2 family uncharacterized protein YibQ
MKKSPKKSGKRTLLVLFWLVFALGCLWVAFVPHKHAVPPQSVTVKVQQPAPPAQSPAVSGGEEQTPAPPEQPLPPSLGNGVIVPVVPEKQGSLPPGHKAKIAIVIDDVGVDLRDSERAIKLPPQITLSFLPYAVRLREQTKQARDNGHELLLHMPMEPLGHEDPGPGALLVDLPMRDLQQRFETALASFVGFDGVNNHMGSKFTAFGDGMTMVVDELQQRHLFYLDSRTSAASVGKQVAEQKGLPTISRDVFLDDDQSAGAVRAQLAATERVARHKGYAVAIGHPHATTMDVLPEWIADAQRRGFELVPVNELVGR